MKPEDIKREVENLRLTLSQAIAQANELHETELELLSSTEVLASLGKKGIPRKEIVELAKELNEVISDLRSRRPANAAAQSHRGMKRCRTQGERA